MIDMLNNPWLTLFVGIVLGITIDKTWTHATTKLRPRLKTWLKEKLKGLLSD